MKWQYYSQLRQPKLSQLKIVIVCLIIVAAVSVLIGIILARQGGATMLPPSVRSQITFPVFLPTTGVSIDRSSFKYDKSSGVLSFLCSFKDGETVTFAEQATPSAFNDIPNYTEQFMQTLFEYQAFDSLQGTVYLTHPKNAGQVAVMNAKGTLLFARVDKDEPVNLWQEIFNHLTVYTP